MVKKRAKCGEGVCQGLPAREYVENTRRSSSVGEWAVLRETEVGGGCIPVTLFPLVEEFLLFSQGGDRDCSS